MSVAHIHLQASVAPTAKLGSGVQIGPYAVVGDAVELGDGCVLHAHAVVQGPSKMGRDNVFHPFSSIGGDPQDLGFRGEHVELVVGDGNTFRENVTVSRGTAKGGGKTTIGNRNLFLASSHVGHDCHVGDSNLFVNGATLAGHVIVEDFATIGFSSPVHQFCRVGRHAYIGASTVITQDVPPFSLVVTERETTCFGLNKVGLQRFLGRPRAGIASRFSLVVAFEAEYEPGARRDARFTRGFPRRRRTHPVHRECGTRDH